jgi:NAD(P)-dependent dehydrogenase (short-subunit alcohol dehydrogenase family)
VVLAGRDRAALKETVGELEERGLDGVWCYCDVSDEGSVETLVDFVRQHRGCPDLLVNNAGISGSTVPTTELSRSEWDEVLATNLTGPMLCARGFLPAMIERGAGHIVNIGSIAGKRPLLNRAAYAASKLGLIGLTRTLAEETGPYGIRVNAISPGAVTGERIQRVLSDQAQSRRISLDDVVADFTSSTPLRRFVQAEEIADAVIALHQLSGVTGIDLNVTGGLVMY